MTTRNELFLEQLTAEYRILQDKIDKIGAFRFTIRGWSVTLVVGTTFAISSSKSASASLLLFLLAFVALFCLAEWKQNNLQAIFANRAFQIEKEIRRALRMAEDSAAAGSAFGFSPRIAHELSEIAQQTAPRGKFKRLKKWVRDPDVLFYVVQFAVIIIAAVLLWREKGSRPESEASHPITVIEHNIENCVEPEQEMKLPNAKEKN